MSTKNTTIDQFRKIIWSYYKKNKRDFPWRPPSLKLRRDLQIYDPYKIFISEVMLQQTQTYRVQPKYEAWIERFPNFESLANAPFSEILSFWQGLGYNRRALYLHKAAQKIVTEHNGKVPKDPEELVKMPGIGIATASSIIVFAYNIPLPFIETNIRRVYIHHFFNDKINIHDKDIFTLVKKSINLENPREWYYALMDYGSALPKTVTNPNRSSKHYTKQSKFEGSLRQVRGAILRILTAENPIEISRLQGLVKVEPDRFEKALHQLHVEGFLEIQNNKASIK